ncbi:MAG: class I SAM-dependent methyltransferase [Anaerolineae bacterium]|nr:class I SAM-dependent methyltransferase [Anaerolineae bacterium]
MQPETVARLLEINRIFYSRFGPSFAATRRRLQNGVRRVLQEHLLEGNWLDLGCGSGALATAWLAERRSGCYIGVDQSAELLAEARSSVGNAPGVEFHQADLAGDVWANLAQGIALTGVTAFAVLHHLPSAELRVRLLRRVADLLPPGGWFIHSEWQFQHDPKWLARQVAWSQAGLQEEDVEAGDTLLDWRFSLPNGPEETGLRYVHLFSREELADLAACAGFLVRWEFSSDGHCGQLGLYQGWQKIS